VNRKDNEPVTGRREQKRHDNRAAIIRAAIDMFGQNGVGGTTVRDIIRNTDLAAGTFYNYFNTKDCVFRSIVDEVGRDLRARLKKARAQATDAESFIEACFRVYFEFYAENPKIFLMLRANQTYSGTFLDVNDHQARTGLNELKEDIVAAMESGLLVKQDVDFLTNSIGGAAFALVEEMMQRKPVDPKPVTEFAVSLFTAGMTSVGTKNI